jgi:hypothetical protein
MDYRMQFSNLTFVEIYMKHIAKALVLAAAVAAVGAAQAQTASATLSVGTPPVKAFGYEMGNLRGGGTLTFSDTLIGALETGGIVMTAVAPATVTQTTTDAGTQISAAAPIQSLSGDFDASTALFSATQVATKGGALMTAAKKNFATNTGSLSLTNLTVDIASKSIFGDLLGGNGVGAKDDVHIWTYTDIAGATVLPATAGTIVANNKLTGLVITENAFNLFATSLGLTTGGKAAMSSITDYGVMDALIQVDVKVPGGVVTPTVPEPSTYVMMGLGLVGLAFASKRARA